MLQEPSPEALTIFFWSLNSTPTRAPASALPHIFSGISRWNIILSENILGMTISAKTADAAKIAEKNNAGFLIFINFYPLTFLNA